MPTVIVSFKDGTSRTFEDTGRAGGSYTNHVHYEGCFVVVIDAYDNKYIYPANDIKNVEVKQTRGAW